MTVQQFFASASDQQLSAWNKAVQSGEATTSESSFNTWYENHYGGGTSGGTSGTGQTTDPKQSWSAQQLADYVKSNGLTNLQQYSWWSNNPNKTEAWNIISTTTPTQTQTPTPIPTQTPTAPTAQKPSSTPQELWDKLTPSEKDSLYQGYTNEGFLAIKYNVISPSSSVYKDLTDPNMTLDQFNAKYGTQNLPQAATTFNDTTIADVRDKKAQDAFTSEFTQLQQYLAANPEIRTQLLNEVTQFDSYYNEVEQNLQKAKQNQLDKLQATYQQTIDSINLNTSQTDQQKQEAIKNVTNDFVAAHDELNLSRDIAYQNAATTLTNTYKQGANAAAQAYVDTLNKGVSGGTIETVSADNILRAIKDQTEQTKTQLEQQNAQLELQNQKVYRQLESQVGTSKAQEIWNQYKSSGDTSAISDALKSVPGLTLPSAFTQPTSQQNLVGAIPMSVQQSQEKASLASSQALQDLGLNKTTVEQTAADTALKLSKQKTAEKAQALQSMSSTIPYVRVPSVTDPTAPGAFLVGSAAKSNPLAKSALQRNIWTNKVPTSTWSI